MKLDDLFKGSIPGWRAWPIMVSGWVDQFLRWKSLELQGLSSRHGTAVGDDRSRWWAQVGSRGTTRGLEMMVTLSLLLVSIGYFNELPLIIHYYILYGRNIDVTDVPSLVLPNLMPMHPKVGGFDTSSPGSAIRLGGDDISDIPNVGFVTWAIHKTIAFKVDAKSG